MTQLASIENKQFFDYSNTIRLNGNDQFLYSWKRWKSENLHSSGVIISEESLTLFWYLNNGELNSDKSESRYNFVIDFENVENSYNDLKKLFKEERESNLFDGRFIKSNDITETRWIKITNSYILEPHKILLRDLLLDFIWDLEINRNFDNTNLRDKLLLLIRTDSFLNGIRLKLLYTEFVIERKIYGEDLLNEIIQLDLTTIVEINSECVLKLKENGYRKIEDLINFPGNSLFQNKEINEKIAWQAQKISNKDYNRVIKAQKSENKGESPLQKKIDNFDNKNRLIAGGKVKKSIYNDMKIDISNHYLTYLVHEENEKFCSYNRDTNSSNWFSTFENELQNFKKELPKFIYEKLDDTNKTKSVRLLLKRYNLIGALEFSFGLNFNYLWFLLPILVALSLGCIFSSIVDCLSLYWYICAFFLMGIPLLSTVLILADKFSENHLLHIIGKAWLRLTPQIFFPRMTIAIISGWVLFFTDQNILQLNDSHIFDELGLPIFLSLFAIIILLSFMSNEIFVKAPSAGLWERIRRSLTIFTVGFFISFSFGFIVTPREFNSYMFNNLDALSKFENVALNEIKDEIRMTEERLISVNFFLEEFDKLEVDADFVSILETLNVEVENSDEITFGPLQFKGGSTTSASISKDDLMIFLERNYQKFAREVITSNRYIYLSLQLLADNSELFTLLGRKLKESNIHISNISSDSILLTSESIDHLSDDQLDSIEIKIFNDTMIIDFLMCNSNEINDGVNLMEMRNSMITQIQKFSEADVYEKKYKKDLLVDLLIVRDEMFNTLKTLRSRKVERLFNLNRNRNKLESDESLRSNFFENKEYFRKCCKISEFSKENLHHYYPLRIILIRSLLALFFGLFFQLILQEKSITESV